MRDLLTGLTKDDPRNAVAVDGNALTPELVAALRLVLAGLGDDWPRITGLLRLAGVKDEAELDVIASTAISALRQFVALTSPARSRSPFVLVGYLTDERTQEELIAGMPAKET